MAAECGMLMDPPESPPSSRRAASAAAPTTGSGSRLNLWLQQILEALFVGGSSRVDPSLMLLLG